MFLLKCILTIPINIFFVIIFKLFEEKYFSVMKNNSFLYVVLKKCTFISDSNFTALNYHFLSIKVLTVYKEMPSMLHVQN